MPPIASPFLTAAFAAFAIALALIVVTGISVAARRAGWDRVRRWRWTFRAGALAVLWMGVSWRIAASGALADFDRRPPPLILFLVVISAIAVTIAVSPVGRLLITGLPLAALVGVQAFRLPLELLMHRAAAEGVMPVQMSYSGRNFDIVSGLTAIVTAWFVARGASLRVVAVWNILGIALLVNILIVAVRSTPVFAAYGPDRLNTFVAWPPFVWLPAVMVLTALAGHLVVTRSLMTRQ